MILLLKMEDAIVDYISVYPEGSIDTIKYYLPKVRTDVLYNITKDILENSHLIYDFKLGNVELISLIYNELVIRSQKPKLSSTANEYIPISTEYIPVTNIEYIPVNALQKNYIYLTMNNYVGNQMDENGFIPLDYIYNEIKLNPQFTELSPYIFMQCIKGFPSIVINDGKYNLINNIRNNNIIEIDKSLINCCIFICKKYKHTTVKYLMTNLKILKYYNSKRLLNVLERSQLFDLSKKKICLITSS